MENYKKLSLITLFSLSSIALGYYDPTGRPSFDDFDDQSGGPLDFDRPTKQTILETAAQKQQSNSTQSTRPTSAPSRQNPLPTPQATKPVNHRPSVEKNKLPSILPLTEEQKFENAMNALQNACIALANYNTDLSPRSVNAQIALDEYKKNAAHARRWTGWQFAGVGVTAVSGMAAAIYLLTEPRDAGCAIIAALTGLAGGFTTKKSREAQIERCDAHEQDPYAEDKKPLVTALEQLAGALDEKKYNSLVRAYTEAYAELSNVPTGTLSDVDTRKNNMLGAATNISTLVNEGRVAAIAKQRELEEIFGCPSEQN